MSDDEKIDRSVEGLKQQIRVEVLKAQVDGFEESVIVAHDIDTAI